MLKKILVAYATRMGSTIDIAEEIAKVLREWGAIVEVRSTHERIEVEYYDAVIVGSAIRIGHLLPEAVEFLEKNRAVLKKVPMAYFVSCITMSEDTPENRETVLHYFDPVMQAVPEITPVSIGLFAGTVDPTNLDFFPRLMVKVNKIPIGDFRDWETIRNWTSAIAPSLIGEAEILFP